MRPETMLHAIDTSAQAGVHYTTGALGPETIRYLRLRRYCEIALLFTTFPLTALVGAAVALAVRLDSPGPIFYRQIRPGRSGVPFTMIKFRSMIARGEEGIQSTAIDDPRVTRVGRFIRRMRLDELPQIVNVLRGEMSLIGPRPEPLANSRIAERKIPGYRSRWVVHPGLTGWAQVEQGYVEGIDGLSRKLELDMHYIHNISPRLDALILLKTIRTVLTGAGAR